MRITKSLRDIDVHGGMLAARDWRAYELLDASGGERLERWGETVLIRPDPQVIWNTPKPDAWNHASARYRRSDSGGGSWQNFEAIPGEWELAYRELRFLVRPTGFKHMGLFPEQAANWDILDRIITGAGRAVSILNLFAYTGGATLACAGAGASVCHVDASKGMVDWARRNAALSELSEKPVRWIVDDCAGFVKRELRRGRRYDAIIMDPPSYGRGPGGELWKLEDSLYAMLELCVQALSERPLFFMLNSYTTGLPPSVTRYMLDFLLTSKLGGGTVCYELGLPVTSSGGTLPCGGTALWMSDYSD